MAQALINEKKKTSVSSDIEDELIFFSSIDDATKSWLKSLDQMWGLWKKCDGISQILTDYFETAPNPYLSTLRILVNTSDFYSIKITSSLPYTVIEEFANWIQGRKDVFKDCLEPDLKVAAFKLIIRQKNINFIRAVAATYEFIEHKELFLDTIKKLIDEKKYKEAAQFVAMLQLQNSFPNPETILLPLILQNKLAVVEDYLRNNPELQRSLLKFLDSLLDPEKNMQVILDQFIRVNNITDVQMSTLQTKPMAKLIARFLKMYNLPSNLCPNFSNSRSKGALQFLIHKRYVDGSLSTPSWREMVHEAIGTDEKLQVELLKKLLGVNDVKEGLFWANEFNIPKEHWPWAISTAAELEADGVNEGASTSREENWEGRDEDHANFHKLHLSRDYIKVIDNPRSFEEFLDNGLSGVSVVGIDSEWKPSFGTKQSEVALIQIATRSHVYILDITTMGNQLVELWTELGLVLFENKDVLKLGFGISHDMAVLRESIPVLSKIRTHGQGYLDILRLWEKLVSEYRFAFPYEGDPLFCNKSLSKLVELCLGQRLNKFDQFSNWEKRPLRESQIRYAALDAYCLLEVYDVLQHQCARLDIPFGDICGELQHISSPKKNPRYQGPKPNFNHNVRPELHGERQRFQRHDNPERNQSFQRPPYPIRFEHHNRPREYQRPNTFRRPIPAHKWRAVCDATLGGLANKLRICGCDCLHIVFDTNGEQSASIAMKYNRVLLTRNEGYHQHFQRLPQYNLYKVQADTADEQLREVVQHFRLTITQKDVFSRCQTCNYDEFVKVPKPLMNDLVESFVRIMGKNDQCDLTSLARYDAYISEIFIRGANGYHQQDAEECTQFRTCDDRTWRLSIDTLNVGECLTRYNMGIQIDKVPVDVLRNETVFYICERCGKVYWNGSQLARTLNGTLKDLIV